MDWQDNDWSYVAVAAFLVKHADSRKGDAYLLSRLNVCFVVVACRNATLIPWAFLLPYRLWVYFFTLVSHTSRILALQHLVIPSFVQDENTVRSGNSYIIIRGSSDGSITLDSTTAIDGFMQRTLEFRQEMLMYCQRRPQTGRISQGDGWWKSLKNQSSQETIRVSLTMQKLAIVVMAKVPNKFQLTPHLDANTLTSAQKSTNIPSSEICQILRLHIFQFNSSVWRSLPPCFRKKRFSAVKT
ncbi:uncharacterized protein A4U43_C03F1610 [Asparagus officinalis]|uniref:Uncharacterized protein n=1 Tax=Asparagus officinalis TaxID=4686 RepID=A0A5P1F6H5_ASPOF|nr:uncharacterized protein A4U43_C03F1610 [Asparagus officinalis]